MLNPIESPSQILFSSQLPVVACCCLHCDSCGFAVGLGQMWIEIEMFFTHNVGNWTTKCYSTSQWLVHLVWRWSVPLSSQPSDPLQVEQNEESRSLNIHRSDEMDKWCKSELFRTHAVDQHRFPFLLKAWVCTGLSPKIVEFQNHSEEALTPWAVHVSMTEWQRFRP